MACLVECPQVAEADKERRNPKSQFDPTPDMDATVLTQSLLLFENRPIHLTRITVHLTFELDRNP
jgi:hypothetical protein